MDKHPLMPEDVEEEELLNGLDTVASATECTGLIPSSPANEEEAESYTELYDIPLPIQPVDNGLQSKKKKHGKR